MRRKAVSTIVATVVLMLITVSAVSILWMAVAPMLDLEELTRTPAAIGSHFEIVTGDGYTFFDEDKNLANIQVTSTGEESAEYVQVILTLENGVTLISVHNAPGHNQKRRYIFDVEDYGKPRSVTVAPVSIVRGRISIGVAQDTVEFGERVETVEFYDDYEVLAPTLSYAGGLEELGGGDDACSLSSEGCSSPLIYNGDAELGSTDGWEPISGDSGVTTFTRLNTTDVHGGVFSFEKHGHSQVRSSQFKEVTDDKYYISGWFKSVNESNLSYLYYGFVPYDELKREIGYASVHGYVGSEAVLLEDAHSEGLVFNISSCYNWQDSGHHEFIAFEVDDSGNYDDLPNFDLSRKRDIVSITPVGDSCEIVMNASEPQVYSQFPSVVYPAGTKVREHYSGGTFMYAAHAGFVPAEWTYYEAVVQGECPGLNC